LKTEFASLRGAICGTWSYWVSTHNVTARWRHWKRLCRTRAHLHKRSIRYCPTGWRFVKINVLNFKLHLISFIVRHKWANMASRLLFQFPQCAGAAGNFVRRSARNFKITCRNLARERCNNIESHNKVFICNLCSDDEEKPRDAQKCYFASLQCIFQLLKKYEVVEMKMII
jgi:hypothetical protein